MLSAETKECSWVLAFEHCSLQLKESAERLFDIKQNTCGGCGWKLDGNNTFIFPRKSQFGNGPIRRQACAYRFNKLAWVAYHRSSPGIQRQLKLYRLALGRLCYEF